MPVVNVSNILEQIREDLLLVLPANGYANKIKSAEIGYRQLSENNNFISAFLFTGKDSVTELGNSNIPALNEVEIYVSLQAQANTGQKNAVLLGESLKKDMRLFAYQYANTDKYIFNSLTTMDSNGVVWRGWSIPVIDSFFEWKENKVEIFCTLKVMYNTEAGALAVGDTPVLTSPIDSAVSQPTATIFNWTGTGTSYEIQIATDSGFLNVVVSQSGLTSSSYTVPADLLLSNSTVYYWRVRAVNLLSAWTTTRSFTTAAGDAVPDFRTGLVAEWDADAGVTQSGALVSAWLDQVGGYNLVQATGGLKPTQVLNGLNTTKAYMLTDGTKYMDIASAINLVNFTIVAVFKSDNVTPAGREFIFGGAVQGIMGMATVANGNHTYGVFSGGIRSVAYSAGDIATWHIRSFLNTKLWSNGVEGTYNSTGATPTLSLSRLFCRADNTTQTFTGKLARFRVYSGVLSTTDRAIAETYLNSVYAIY